jgi:hypothetical protein
LYWKQLQFKKTVPYDPSTNIATMQLAPSYRSFLAYCAELPDDEPTTSLIMMSDVISDEEDDGESSLGASTAASVIVPQTREIDNEPMPSTTTTIPATKSEKTTTFSLDGPLETSVIEDQEVNIADLQSELMHWHYRLGSYKKLKRMALAHESPYRLRHARPFRCSACMFSKATKKPWRTKAPVNQRTVPMITAPGDWCVSIDQLESKTPGLVAQMKSPVLTKHHYPAATVFVNQFSHLSFIYLQYSGPS